MNLGPEQTMADHMREKRRNGFLYLTLALVVAMLMGFAYRTDRRADDSAAQIEVLKGQVQTNGGLARDAKEAAEEGNRRLVAAGKPTVPVPTAAPISASPSPPDGLNAEEISAVRSIVAEQVASRYLTQAEITQIARVAATLVPKPKDGKTPTPAELQPIVTATLAAYCVGDKCVGKTGSTGQKGDPGEPGQDAPKVTDAELLAAAQQALVAYCGQDSKPCQGTPGVDGKDAPPPYSIVDTDCLEDGSWRIYLSNGTDQKTLTADGPCRVGLGLK